VWDAKGVGQRVAIDSVKEQHTEQQDSFDHDAFISYRRLDGTFAARSLRARLLEFALPSS
jgi:hypothetical protein